MAAPLEPAEEGGGEGEMVVFNEILASIPVRGIPAAHATQSLKEALQDVVVVFIDRGMNKRPFVPTVINASLSPLPSLLTSVAASTGTYVCSNDITVDGQDD